ncbi:MAG: hypothetical protein AAGF10_01790 [Verrucomicrobiota bacterium]
MSSLIFLPVACAASLYAFGSHGIKRSMELGAKSRKATAVTNLMMAAWSLPLFFVSRGDFDLGAWLTAIAAGAALFVGRIFSVKALETGDLSIVGPLLGMKTLLVAVFALITGLTTFHPWLWAAVLLATVGVLLLQLSPAQQAKHVRKAALYAGAASILFALTDILIVEARGQLGIGWLTPTLFMTVALLTPLLGKQPAAPELARKPLYFGSVVMGFQTSLVVFMIGITGEAVIINIIYATRALWTVVVDRALNRSEIVKAYFMPRMVGAVCLVSAVVVVIILR